MFQWPNTQDENNIFYLLLLTRRLLYANCHCWYEAKSELKYSKVMVSIYMSWVAQQRKRLEMHHGHF
jgi:hypothetical protein